jgi:predicted GNAT superfamily acetyltransferase
MTGVLPQYQAQDIGFRLKQKQREWALENGFAEIGWTFDPLKRGNANFNLHRLGVIAKVYHVNFYGQMEDAINSGTPSDSLEVIWNLTDMRVQALANGKSISPDYPTATPETIILKAVDNLPVTALNFESSVAFAEVPSTLSQLSDKALAEWRFALREALQEAFGCGYMAVNFLKQQNRFYYVLRRL